MGLGGVAIVILPSIMCLKLTFSDGLGGHLSQVHQPSKNCTSQAILHQPSYTIHPSLLVHLRQVHPLRRQVHPLLHPTSLKSK